jgi:hypothetical protein
LEVVSSAAIGRPQPSWLRCVATASTLVGFSKAQFDDESFQIDVEKVLLPTLRSDDIVIMDNLGNTATRIK